MALSELTKSNIEDAKSHLRGAIRSAATNDEAAIVTALSRILQELDSVEKYSEMNDAISSFMNELRGRGGSQD